MGLAVVAALALGAQGRALADWQVWTVTETRHVLRSELAGSDRTVALAAARNEWESFQILTRSDAPVKGIRLGAGDLRGPKGAILRARDARLYRQHQLHIQVGTYRNDAFKPDWYPDPLIPFEHPMPGRRLEGARFIAVPFDLPSGETHGFWVDVYVPTDTKPGEYRGMYRITAEGRRPIEIPVSVTVWDFALPRVSTLATAFGSPAGRMRAYYRERAKAGTEPEPADWTAVEEQVMQLLAEHHINATPPVESVRPVAEPGGLFRIPPEQVLALRKFVDRYHANAVPIPHPSTVVTDPEREWDRLRAWLAAFDRAATELERPQVVFYVYLKDEPNTLEDYRYVQKWGRAIRNAKSVVKVLVVEQTWTEPGRAGADSAWGDLYGAVDIWCPLFSLHRPESAARRQALGEIIWAYTALAQGEPTPWWHIDYPLLNYRVPAWIAWRYGIRGLLYWGMSYWQEVDDPWVGVPIYGSRAGVQPSKKTIVFNGEGSLVYPARAVGYDGIVPSIRLKALRDAIEDYEYLAILGRQGRAEAAGDIVGRMARSWFEWGKSAPAYGPSRRQLAELILSR